MIDSPDVYKSGDQYIVFGEARIQDLGSQAQATAAEQFKAQNAAGVPAMPSEAVAPISEVAESSESVDETGVAAKDIELVMQQASCSRADAVAALKKNNNDIVNAIMVCCLSFMNMLNHNFLNIGTFHVNRTHDTQ